MEGNLNIVNMLLAKKDIKPDLRTNVRVVFFSTLCFLGKRKILCRLFFVVRFLRSVRWLLLSFRPNYVTFENSVFSCIPCSGPWRDILETHVSTVVNCGVGHYFAWNADIKWALHNDAEVRARSTKVIAPLFWRFTRGRNATRGVSSSERTGNRTRYVC